MFPVALAAAACFLIARKSVSATTAFGAGAVACTLGTLGLLQLRSELWPFLGVLKDNIMYSQGALIESTTLIGSMKEHFRRVEGNYNGMAF
jgi:hypothetical protein